MSDRTQKAKHERARWQGVHVVPLRFHKGKRLVTLWQVLVNGVLLSRKHVFPDHKLPAAQGLARRIFEGMDETKA